MQNLAGGCHTPTHITSMQFPLNTCATHTLFLRHSTHTGREQLVSRDEATGVERILSRISIADNLSWSQIVSFLNTETQSEIRAHIRFGPHSHISFERALFAYGGGCGASKKKAPSNTPPQSRCNTVAPTDHRSAAASSLPQSSSAPGHASLGDSSSLKENNSQTGQEPLKKVMVFSDDPTPWLDPDRPSVFSLVARLKDRLASDAKIKQSPTSSSPEQFEKDTDFVQVLQMIFVFASMRSKGLDFLSEICHLVDIRHAPITDRLLISLLLLLKSDHDTQLEAMGGILFCLQRLCRGSFTTCILENIIDHITSTIVEISRSLQRDKRRDLELRFLQHISGIFTYCILFGINVPNKSVCLDVSKCLLQLWGLSTTSGSIKSDFSSDQLELSAYQVLTYQLINASTRPLESIAELSGLFGDSPLGVVSVNKLRQSITYESFLQVSKRSTLALGDELDSGTWVGYYLNIHGLLLFRPESVVDYLGSFTQKGMPATFAFLIMDKIHSFFTNSSLGADKKVYYNVLDSLHENSWMQVPALSQHFVRIQALMEAQKHRPADPETTLFKIASSNTSALHSLYSALEINFFYETFTEDSSANPLVSSDIHDLRTEKILESRQFFAEKVMGLKFGVILITGERGSGKSSFARQAISRLWETYRTSRSIPLYLQLSRITSGTDPIEFAIEASRCYGASASPSPVSKQDFLLMQTEQQSFTLVIDEADLYHTIDPETNPYRSLAKWNVQTIILARHEILPVIENMEKHLSDSGLVTTTDIQRFKLCPLDTHQQLELYKNHIQRTGDCKISNPKEFLGHFKQLTPLQDWSGNPEFLSIFCQYYPSFLQPKASEPQAVLNTKKVAQQIIRKYIDSSYEREYDLIKASVDSLDQPITAQNIVNYATEIARHLYETKTLYLNIHAATEDGIQRLTSRGHQRNRLLQRMSFFSLTLGHELKFAHNTLPLALLDQLPEGQVPIDLRFTKVPLLTNSNTLAPMDAQSISLNQLWMRSARQQRKQLTALATRAQKELPFRAQLLETVIASRNDPNLSEKASEAISILNYARVSFYGMDLRGIRVPSADLSEAIFDKARLDDADLSDCILLNASFCRANLKGTKFDGAQFSIFPSFYACKGRVLTCEFLVHGNQRSTFVCVSSSGSISTSDFPESTKVETHTLAVPPVCSHIFPAVSQANVDPFQLYYGTESGAIRCWDGEARNDSELLHVHSGTVHDIDVVQFSDRGVVVITGGSDGKVCITELKTPTLLAAMSGHVGAVLCVCSRVCSDGSLRIVSGGVDRTVRVWDGTSYSQTALWSGHFGDILSVSPVMGSSNLDLVVSTSADCSIRVWSLLSGQQVACFFGHEKEVVAARAITTGQDSGQDISLVSVSLDGTMREWDWITRGVRECYILPTDDISCLSTIGVVQGRPCIACGTASGPIYFRQAVSRLPEVFPRGHEKLIVSLCMTTKSNGGLLCISASDDMTVRAWDLESGCQEWCLYEEKRPTSLCLVSDHGNRPLLIVGYEDGSVRSMQVDSSERVQEWNRHKGKVSSLCSSKLEDGRVVVASGGADGTFCVWTLADDEVLYHRVVANHAGVWSMCFVDHGQGDPWLATGSQDEVIHLWDMSSGEEVRMLIGHSDIIIWMVSFRGPDGECMLASSGRDNSIRIWDVFTGVAYHILDGHGQDVMQVIPLSLHSEVVMLVSCSRDKTVRWWDVSTGAELRSFGPFPSPLYSLGLAFDSQDRVKLVVGGFDGSICVYDTLLSRKHASLVASFIDENLEIGFPASAYRVDLVAPCLVDAIGGRRHHSNLLAVLSPQTSTTSTVVKDVFWECGAVCEDDAAFLENASAWPWLSMDQAQHIAKMHIAHDRDDLAASWLAKAGDVLGLVRYAATRKNAWMHAQQSKGSDALHVGDGPLDISIESPYVAQLRLLTKRGRFSRAATYGLACCVLGRWGVSKDSVSSDAVRLVLQFAQDGNPAALQLIGAWMTTHLAREERKTKARLDSEILLLLQTLESVLHPLGRLWLHAGSVLDWEGWEPDLEDASKALSLLTERGHRTAFRLVERLAKRGLASAQFMMGFCYRNGIHVEKSMEQCVRWYQSSAKQNYPAALCGLGLRFMNGEGINRDPARALDAFISAADRGDLEAKQILSEERQWFLQHLSKDSTRLAKMQRVLSQA
eukprot:TRINITY_DN8109_c0_g1_i1.p1 TRINITY_DN8109_c0_g1~~TRINITY_DN8109_c0_g1_i1.p1  ORF type:complete len:2159 (+),score=328.87 TRINITY_DN8109_c0_g1_i1:143-6619(+)